MAKKKKKLSLSKILYLVAVCLGVVAICMCFVTSMKVSGSLGSSESVLGSNGKSFTGLQTVFGCTENKYTFLEFSFMNLLPYILVLLASIFALVKLFGKLKVGGILSFVLFAVAGVLFLLNVNFAVLSESFGQTIKLANALTTVVTKSLGIGAIISAICSFGGAIAVVATKFVK